MPSVKHLIPLVLLAIGPAIAKQALARRIDLKSLGGFLGSTDPANAPSFIPKNNAPAPAYPRPVVVPKYDAPEVSEHANYDSGEDNGELQEQHWSRHERRASISKYDHRSFGSGGDGGDGGRGGNGGNAGSTSHRFRGPASYDRSGSGGNGGDGGNAGSGGNGGQIKDGGRDQRKHKHKKREEEGEDDEYNLGDANSGYDDEDKVGGDDSDDDGYGDKREYDSEAGNRDYNRDALDGHYYGRNEGSGETEPYGDSKDENGDRKIGNYEGYDGRGENMEHRRDYTPTWLGPGFGRQGGGSGGNGGNGGNGGDGGKNGGGNGGSGGNGGDNKVGILVEGYQRERGYHPNDGPYDRGYRYGDRYDTDDRYSERYRSEEDDYYGRHDSGHGHRCGCGHPCDGCCGGVGPDRGYRR